MIILSFGSNLKSNIGNKKQNIEFAYRELKKNKVRVIKKSAFYETNSYPNKNNPKFINTVAIVETILDEFKLLQVLLKIEKKAGRIRNIKYDPRTLDIDIISFNNQVLSIKKNNKKLVIPHKHYKNREFVILPLEEIAPNWIDPQTNYSISQIKSVLEKSKLDNIRKL